MILFYLINLVKYKINCEKICGTLMIIFQEINVLLILLLLYSTYIPSLLRSIYDLYIFIIADMIITFESNVNLISSVFTFIKKKFFQIKYFLCLNFFLL